ncbi:MAG: bifunctional ornithine acetyltransferase/N-acetylglutamate synthase [Actinomycetota bacterium]
MGVEITGIAKGAGMLAPALATMLCTIMTDANLEEIDAQSVLSRVVDRTFNRLDSDGCMSTNDTILLLASGSSGVHILESQLEEILETVCSSLCNQLIGDAEGKTKIVSIEVVHAESEVDAVAVARQCARNNLLKCALFGGDPNWGRILAAVGTANATFDPLDIDVQLNGVWICRGSAPGDSKDLVDLSGESIHILIDLKIGTHSAVVLTNDLSHDYVHENSAYAS